jgi:hypothetical protein
MKTQLKLVSKNSLADRLGLWNFGKRAHAAFPGS